MEFEPCLLYQRKFVKDEGAKSQRYDRIYEEQKYITVSRGGVHDYVYQVQLQTFHIISLH